MLPALFRPQGRLTPDEASELARQAPEILRKNPKAFSASPLRALFSAPETAQLWTVYENLLLSCLQVGHDDSARQCLERLVTRFGPEDERVMALQGLAQEAMASNESELQKILNGYEACLVKNDANIPIWKRKVALLRSMGRISESVAALNTLLEFDSTDAEAWAELADMHVTLGLYPQAIYALEEVLVLMPYAWNIHARLGEVSLMAADATSDGQQKHLAEAVKRFCRSIELCDDYLRAYYGLKLVTDRILHGESRPRKQQEETEGFDMVDVATLEKLNQAATKKLVEIIHKYRAGEKLWQGYNAGEIAAARHLLDQASAHVVR
ncbi:Tetratricopeptide repeat domain-containing protein [Ophiocordyceps camponoti-floridani]|uniref:ER membrane protein complex subunit 2 n=1 Tax=Ophiocordyceps camponoti-floridani TaxID=2030778 RepID=A0A8H4Q4E1_9HYPO|nr:Tetratricopeptide repeat domain-containing protein [Ophiocordyceps camponoti-floridani]